jgi:hypothetical protein
MPSIHRPQFGCSERLNGPTFGTKTKSPLSFGAKPTSGKGPEASHHAHHIEKKGIIASAFAFVFGSALTLCRASLKKMAFDFARNNKDKAFRFITDVAKNTFEAFLENFRKTAPKAL